jgi:formyl-CoA transferase
MVRLVSQTIASKPAAEWLVQLEAAGIPAGPINTITQALSDTQAQHRAVVRTIAGVPLVGSPVRLNGERQDSHLAPPALGEHTDEVLGELGLKTDAVARLKTAGIAG